MKLSVINENRQPESVSPKIRVYDTEEELNNDLANLSSGTIVATKEDVTSEVAESRDNVYFYKVAATSTWYPVNVYFVADKPQGYVHVVMIKNNTQMVNVIWDVANASINYVGMVENEQVTAGLNDNVYVGKASLRIGTDVRNSVKTFFVTTKDCVIEHIETR